jgi:hypothetical protein
MRMPASLVTMTFGARRRSARQARRRESAENHRVDRPDAHRREHREDRLGIIGM